MPTGSGNGPASTDHSAPDNRLLIEILSWDWALHVGMAPDGVPQEHRHQGGLLYGRGLDIVGQIVAPERRHGQSVRVWIAPCSPDLAFGPGGLGDVGRCDARNQLGVHCT